MREIEMSHLWNMGDGGWIEEREDGHYLCSSYISTKGFTRGNISSSEKKLSEDEYKSILEAEDKYLQKRADDAEKASALKLEKQKRIEAYMAVSPFFVDGEPHIITKTGQIEWKGNHVCSIPTTMPTNNEHARELLLKRIKWAAKYMIE